MIKKYENWNPPLSEKAIKRRGGYKNRSNSRQWAHWWQNRKETRESPRYSRKIGDGGLFQTQVAPLHSTLGSSLAVVVFFFFPLWGFLTTPNYIGHHEVFFLFLFGRLYCFLSRLELKITSATCRNISPGLSNFVSTLLYQSWKCLPHRLSSSFLSGGVENFFFLPPFSSCSTRNGFLMTGRLLRACGFFFPYFTFLLRERDRKREWRPLPWPHNPQRCIRSLKLQRIAWFPPKKIQKERNMFLPSSIRLSMINIQLSV